MTGSNWSTTLILYVGNNSSTNYTVQCFFDIFLFLRYAGTITVVLGLIGNSFSIIVFSRKALRSRSCSLYFLALSVSDICVLAGYTMENLLFHGYGIQLLSNAFTCKAVIFLIYASTDISNYLLTLAAIDRCVLVSCPAGQYRFCRKSVASQLIALVVGVFSFVNSHFLYGFEVDQTGACLPVSGIYGHFYVHHYDSYIDVIKTVLIPFLLIFICNIIIIVKLAKKQGFLSRTASTRRRRRRQEKDRQLTGLLLLTSILFIVLTLPSEINDSLRSGFAPQFQAMYVCQLWISTTVCILLHQMNHASHFYVYTLSGPIFRKEFQKFLCQCRPEQAKRDSCEQSRKMSAVSHYAQHVGGKEPRVSLFQLPTPPCEQESCQSIV